MRTTAMLCCCALLFSCTKALKKEDHQLVEVKKTDQAPTLDGKANEPIWEQVPWLALDQNWVGSPYNHEDFGGRYKLVWDSDAIYLLVEIIDDVLYDKTKDPLKLFWDDDCLEIFLDPDNSGGLHQYSYNAFAYHVALDGSVVDQGPEKKPQLYPGHVRSKTVTEGNLTTWELAIKLFGDTYVDGKENIPVQLVEGDKIGFALAYCDNDGSMERENFIGSVFVPGEDKDQGWIDANIFGTLLLKE